MTYPIQTIEDLRWFMAHTQGFHGGQITDMHLSKRRIFDEESGRNVLAGSTVTVLVHYHVRGILRIAKLTMQGVSDLSIMEQDGTDPASLGVVQVEFTEGKLRFWFDPHGELYVVCEEALLEEVSMPHSDADREGAVAQWTFQADEGEAPSVTWLLDQLDRAGMPCIWRAAGCRTPLHRMMSWEGELIAAADVNAGLAAAVGVQAYGPADGAGFGMRVRLHHTPERSSGRLLSLVADLITQSFPGTCLVGQTFLSHGEWSNWKSVGRAYQVHL